MNKNNFSSVPPFLLFHGGDSVIREKHMSFYNRKISVMDSYNNWRNRENIIWKPWWSHLFLDSGAFSVSTKKVKISLDEYIKFLKSNEEYIDYYASLDVINDEDLSLDNWRKMRKEGLNPIPVFHIGEREDTLKEYLDNCSYIGLGGVAKESQYSRLLFFERIFNQFPNRKKVGFHAFGVTAFWILERFPWRSVDSTLIAVNARMGRIFLGRGINQFKAYTISERAKQENLQEGEKENIIRKEFALSNLDYEKAKKGNDEGIAERQFFSLYQFEKYLRIPEEYSPKFRMNYVFEEREE